MKKKLQKIGNYISVVVTTVPLTEMDKCIYNVFCACQETKLISPVERIKIIIII